jgi:hypothetical protein
MALIYPAIPRPALMQELSFFDFFLLVNGCSMKLTRPYASLCFFHSTYSQMNQAMRFSGRRTNKISISYRFYLVMVSVI